MESSRPLYVLILAGGSGERFWPLSRKARPKQLLALFSKESLLEATVRRLDGLVPPEQILILTNTDQEAGVRALCPQLPRENIVAEQWGIDPQGNENLAARGFKFLEGLSFVREVAAVKNGMGQKMATIARTLIDGHRSVSRGGFALHLVVEGTSAKDVEMKIGQARRILVPLALKELPSTIPQITRAKPFRASLTSSQFPTRKEST